MNHRILIVDDSPIIRSVIQKNLHLAGIALDTCLQAGHGQEALDLLAEHWVDLLFVDINMPVMNGVELVRRMSEDPILRTIPVIIASTEGSQTRMEELEALGIAGYLRKPFTPEAFKELVTDILENHHAA